MDFNSAKINLACLDKLFSGMWVIVKKKMESSPFSHRSYVIPAPTTVIPDQETVS
jgi:hypothetical protein